MASTGDTPAQGSCSVREWRLAYSGTSELCTAMEDHAASSAPSLPSTAVRACDTCASTACRPAQMPVIRPALVEGLICAAIRREGALLAKPMQGR